MNIQHQKGIGLVEVMVALLLLAVAVLGFSALQMRAIGATDESLVRTRGTSVVRALSETMRNNISHLSDISKVINGTTTFSINCADDSITCSQSQMAQYEAQRIRNRATNEGFAISMVTCPGTSAGQSTNCAVIAWGNTTATLGTGINDCANSEGTYKRGSTCLIMETY